VEPQEKATPYSVDSLTGSHGQETSPPVTLPAAAQPVPMQSVEQVTPQPDPFAVMADVQAKTAPAVSPLATGEQAVPLPAEPADASSAESLMEVIRPDEGSKTEPNAAGLTKTDKKIIAVGGGKGGVGKSTFSANLAVGLALLGQKVVLADLDLGGADVHLYTGVKSLAKTWNDFLDKKSRFD